ncbi:MAG: hypothetical protein EBV46_03050, partial [Burkholderiaceae bacterium]|nr:hypothetical protein [Burkholderiaceae bacterium]
MEKTKMDFDVLTLFPEMFAALTQYGVTGRACEQQLTSVTTWNIRDFSEDSRKTVDDRGNTVKSAMSRSYEDGTLRSLSKIESVFGLRPRNKEQLFSLDLLMDENIKLLSMIGKAGCGKTLLAIAAGLEQLSSVGSQQKYQKLIVSRPVQPVGKDIGYLPGTLEEKMEPWIAPVKDNLDFLLGINGKKSGRKSKDNLMSSDPY